MRIVVRSRSSTTPGSERSSTLTFQELLDFLIPPGCAACGVLCREVLCETCHAALPWLDASESGQAGPAPLQSTVAAVAFSGEVRNWIHRFKYPAKGISQTHPEAIAVVQLLARAAADRARDIPPSYVVPVPAHRRRFQRRGFNPTYRVALEIARHQGVRLETQLLARVRDTAPQAGLDRRTRLANMLGAFACPMRKLYPSDRVWLVDDVITTGATLANAARALQQAGIRDVVGICLARPCHPDVTDSRLGGRGPSRLTLSR